MENLTIAFISIIIIIMYHLKGETCDARSKNEIRQKLQNKKRIFRQSLPTKRGEDRMKTQLTAIDIHRCYIVTITQHHDLEECRKVCDHADRCIKIEDVKSQ